ncbi:YczE/YyaS/YitT family protein [Terrilactibacillus laevilacticus]|uniref:YczE/YyaS/YitT family protein n=1 Tax=Terrilactibacillus laevilacticus TaxID=1380157 RepID=UPI00114760C1|nr:hypothetical protein [Terrilactibacillus laevilacticus]
MKKNIALLCLSILLNAFGNALTVKAALGSAPWTAAGLNISNLLHITVGNALILLGLLALIVDDILRKKWNKMKDIYNFLYLLCFGYFIDLWLLVLTKFHVNLFAFRLIVCVFGIMCIGCALSIYLRLNVVLHPFDDMLKILREKYFKGNTVIAQRLSLGVPLCIGLSIGFINHNIVGINIGTVISFLCMGYFIIFFDKRIHLTLQKATRL